MLRITNLGPGTALDCNLLLIIFWENRSRAQASLKSTSALEQSRELSRNIPLYIIIGYVDGTRFSCLPQASALPLLKALPA